MIVCLIAILKRFYYISTVTNSREVRETVFHQNRLSFQPRRTFFSRNGLDKHYKQNIIKKDIAVLKTN